jgi:hypothetical protein
MHLYTPAVCVFTKRFCDENMNETLPLVNRAKQRSSNYFIKTYVEKVVEFLYILQITKISMYLSHAVTTQAQLSASHVHVNYV